MEKKLKKAVHEEFAAALHSAWPQFEKVSGACTGAARARGWQVFCWHANEHVWFFLTLIVDLRNAFGFRFMWSDQPDYPADDTGYPFFQNDPAQMPGSHQLFTRQRGAGLLAKEWMVGVNPAFVPAVVVPAAVAELKKALDPIMRKVLKHHGK